VTQVDPRTAALDRLSAVAATTDGFELSRVDLEQRREGDVLGAAQSGRTSGLRLLSVLEHEDEIVTARAAAVEVVTADPTLRQHPALAEAVRLLDESEQSAYLEKA
jgi:ATP-dependent DNA helicase RecG